MVVLHNAKVDVQTLSDSKLKECEAYRLRAEEVVSPK